MNITLILGPLAFLNIFCTSALGQIWPLTAAEVGNETYSDQVLLERREDGRTWFIHAIPQNSNTNVPEVVYGPFELRGFGPYSMLIFKIWLNPTGSEKYVSVSFSDASSARQFYRVLNPHHSQTFLNDFKIKRLVLYSPDGQPTFAFEEHVPKALDVFLLETSTGADSRVRSYVIHDVLGDQEPVMIFHSTEHEMTVHEDYVMFSITPQNSPTKYLYSVQLEIPGAAGHLLHAYQVLNALGPERNIHDLEALSQNTYPSRPPRYECGESSNAGNNNES